MKKSFLAAFSLISTLSFCQTNSSVPDRNYNNGVPLPHTTYPPQPSTVTTNPVDRGDVNNNIRPDTTFLKGQSPDITPPNKKKRERKVKFLFCQFWHVKSPGDFWARQCETRTI